MTSLNNRSTIGCSVGSIFSILTPRCWCTMWQAAPGTEQLTAIVTIVDRGTDLLCNTTIATLYTDHFCVPKAFKLPASLGRTDTVSYVCSTIRVFHRVEAWRATVAVSCGFDTWFAVRLVMDYTISHFTWSILGYLTDPTRSSQIILRNWPNLP